MPSPKLESVDTVLREEIGPPLDTIEIDPRRAETLITQCCDLWIF